MIVRKVAKTWECRKETLIDEKYCPVLMRIQVRLDGINL